MVQLLDGFPPHVAAYEASGVVSKEEYEQVVMARVDKVAADYEQINFLVLLKTDMSNYSIGAFLDYVKISFEHFSRWNRMAIVTDEQWLRIAYRALSPLVHGEIRGYKTADFEEAKKWVSGPFDENPWDETWKLFLSCAVVIGFVALIGWILPSSR